MAENCIPECEIKPPKKIGGSCVKQPRQGGISRLVIASCLVGDLSTMTSEQICTLITLGKIIVSPELIGQRPAASTSGKKFSSKKPEQITNYENSITFQNYLLEDDYYDYDFWSDLKANANSYQFGWLDTNDLFYGWIPDAVFQVMPVSEDSNQGNQYWEGSIKWNSSSTTPELKPILIQNFLTDLLTNCGASEGTCGQIASDFASGIEVSFAQTGVAQTFTIPLYNYSNGAITTTVISNVTVNGYTTVDSSNYGYVIVAVTPPLSAGVGSVIETDIVITTNCAGAITIPLIITLESGVGANAFTISGGTLFADGDVIPTLEVDANSSATDPTAITITRGGTCTAEIEFTVLEQELIAGTGTIAPSVNFAGIENPLVSSVLNVYTTGITELGTWKYKVQVAGCGETYTFYFNVKVV